MDKGVSDGFYWLIGVCFYMELDFFSYIIFYYDFFGSFLKVFIVEIKLGEIYYYGLLNYVKGNFKLNNV